MASRKMEAAIVEAEATKEVPPDANPDGRGPDGFFDPVPASELANVPAFDAEATEREANAIFDAAVATGVTNPPITPEEEDEAEPNDDEQFPDDGDGKEAETEPGESSDDGQDEAEQRDAETDDPEMRDRRSGDFEDAPNMNAVEPVIPPKTTDGFALKHPYSFPGDDRFPADDPYADAPDLSRMGSRLIKAYEDFKPLRGVIIRYYWKRRGGMMNGGPVYSLTSRISGLAKHHMKQGDYAIVLAVDNCKAAGYGAREVEAELFHSLCHLRQNDDGEIKIVGHDVNDFRRAIEEYGLYRPQLVTFADAIQEILAEQAELTDDATAEVNGGELAF